MENGRDGTAIVAVAVVASAKSRGKTTPGAATDAFAMVDIVRSTREMISKQRSRADMGHSGVGHGLPWCLSR